jgi:hypothetical protein
VTQHADDTVDILPDDARMKGTGLQHIRLRDGATDYTISAGDKVLLAFESGDPARPIAIPWDSTVDCGQIYYVDGGAGPSTLYYKPPGGAFALVGNNPATATDIEGLINGGT